MGASKIVWVGRVISVLAALMFVFSAFIKLAGLWDVGKEIARLGLRDSMLFPLGLLELSCAVIYLIPPAAVLGAVLLTGYLGGAILTHWRIADPIWGPLLLGGFVWLGLYLREDRLKALLPFRRS